jgi:hypothetical protein
MFGVAPLPLFTIFVAVSGYYLSISYYLRYVAVKVKVFRYKPEVAVGVPGG